MVDSSSKGTMCQVQSKAEVSARSRVVNDSWVRADWLTAKLWLTARGQYASLYRVISEGLTTHACGYKTVSTRIRSGVIILSKSDVPQGRHALDIIAVSLVTSLLDRLPSRGEYKRVIRCDTCLTSNSTAFPHPTVFCCQWNDLSEHLYDNDHSISCDRIVY